jgi:hypothetical protein
MPPNGPAIKGGCVTRRQHRAVPSTRDGTLAEKLSRCKEGMAHFLPSRYKLRELYECRGTSLIGAANLSPVTNLVAGTGAVSRYKLSRNQKFVKVQDLCCLQMRVSGCNGHYKIVLGAGAKAKSVTNNLPLLSVLATGCYFGMLYTLNFSHACFTLLISLLKRSSPRMFSR